MRTGGPSRPRGWSMWIPCLHVYPPEISAREPELGGHVCITWDVPGPHVVIGMVPEFSVAVDAHAEYARPQMGQREKPPANPGGRDQKPVRILQKVKHRVTIWPSTSIAGYGPQRTEKSNSRCLYTNVHSSMLHDNWGVQATQVYISG